MLADAAIAPVAEVLADPVRVAMLMALSDGREVPAGELALAAGVTAPTASAHLAKLATAGFIGVRRQGRHRFYRLVRPELVQAMEALAVLAPEGTPRTHRQARIGRAVRAARTCYDHLAGQLGVGLTRALLDRGALHQYGQQFEVTRAGSELFTQFGIDLEEVRAKRRGFAPACLDWSERVPHIAGSLGAALLTVLFDRGWIERTRDSRAVTVTLAGRRGFERTFGMKA
ncbi:MAG TPA: metalloregulator ArsR/SmtB family transcription factor [Thermoanaerobaculia bacterium]|nr:metalloregulator ArsR/SmtB family transcription factor [Thermoanaerobaculia bacterium]